MRYPRSFHGREGQCAFGERGFVLDAVGEEGGVGQRQIRMLPSVQSNNRMTVCVRQAGMSRFRRRLVFVET